MKTNQFFSIKRFGKYGSYSLISSYRQTLLFWGAIWLAIFAISLLIMKETNSNWNREGWKFFFMFGFYTSGLLYSGFAFKAFRSKERIISELMIPVSAFERMLYEFLDRIAGFLLLYPVVFYVSSSMAVRFRNALALSSNTNHINSIRNSTFPFETATFQKLTGNLEPGMFGMLFMLSVLVFILALAGSASFRKVPLIKSIVSVGLVVLAIIGYLSLIFSKLELYQTWISVWVRNANIHLSNQQGFLIFYTIVLSTIAIIALIFTYYKLKEKEAL